MNDEMKLAALQAMAAEAGGRGGVSAPMMPAGGGMGAHEAECPNCGHVFMMGSEGGY